MAGIFSLRNWVMKQLMKTDKSGIMRIPDKGKIDFGEMLVREQLFRKGIDPKSITRESQLDNILNTPVVPKSERVKPKKSGEVIEVDFGNFPEKKAQGGRTGLSYLLAEDTNERVPLKYGKRPATTKGSQLDWLELIGAEDDDPDVWLDILKSVGAYQGGGRVPMVFGGSTIGVLKNLLTKFKKTHKIPRGEKTLKPDAFAKSIMTEEDKLRLLQFETNYANSLLEHLKLDRQLFKQLEANKEMKDQGLDFLMKHFVDTQAPHMKNYKSLADIDQAILELETLVKNKTLKEGRQLNAEGGRIGFKEGSKMSRRTFLKLMGGLAALPVVGKLFKFAKPAAKVSETLTQVPIKNIEGMPTWFKPLVNKVIKEGTEVPSGAERVIVHKTKLPESKTDVYVNQDLGTGDVWVDIGIEKHGFPDGKYGQPVRLQYKAKEIIEPDMDDAGKIKAKGKEVPEEFNVEEAEFTGGHPENVKFEESTIEKFGDHGSNFDEVEMFATGKVKKVKTKSKPRPMDQKDIDYASGGLARMLGE
jgi:hypothetical protein